MAKDRERMGPLFIPGIFLGGRIPHTYNFPQTAVTLCSLIFFSAGTTDYKLIYHGKFLSMDNKHRKLFALSGNQMGKNSCLKSAKYVRLQGSARACGEIVCAPPDTLTAVGGA